MVHKRLSQAGQYRAGRARSITLGVIALCSSLAFLADPGAVQLWATGVAQASETRDVTIDNYTFSFTFNKAGTYAYHCSLHPHMTGKIFVQ